MKILITGAKGLVGRATAMRCSEIGDDCLAYSRQELDISDREQILEILEREKPQAVINCAAFTDVDGAETKIESCYSANAYGVENLALACRKIDAAFVTISTDYIFDGTKDGFYTQRDNPNPQGIYAKSKLEGEILTRNAHAGSIVVRTGWIFGMGGTNFLCKIPQFLIEGKSVKAISDSFGTPTYAVDLAKRLRDLAELDIPGIYHVTNAGDGTSYAGFAKAVGIKQNLVEEVSGESLHRPAPRPKFSRLACLVSEKFGLAPLPHWQDSLQNYVLEIQANLAKEKSAG